MTTPPYQPSYDTDEQEAIMEASTAFACKDCDKTFAGAHALAIHRSRKHRPQKARPRAAQKARAQAPQATANGTVDELVHQLALALLDETLARLREQVRAAL